MALLSVDTLANFGFYTPPPLSVSPSLIFVETEDQVRQVLSDPQHYKADAYVALEPEAAWALRQAGKPYLKLEDGYAESDLCELAQRVLNEQLNWANEVDYFLQDRLPDFRGGNFRPASLYLYWLKVMLDTLYIRSFPVKWALENWKPARVIYPGGSPTQHQFGWDLMFHQTLYPMILAETLKHFPMIEGVLPPPPKLEKIESSASGAPHWLVRHPFKKMIYPFARWLRMWGRGMRAGMNFTGRDAYVISPTYDLAEVGQELRQAQQPVATWEMVVERFRHETISPRISDEMQMLWHEILRQPFFRQIAQQGDNEFWFLVEDRLSFWWHTLIPQQWAAYVAAHHFYKTKPPRAIVVPSLSDHVERGVFSAFRSLSVPTYIYQHGGFVGWCEDVAWDVTDPLLADYQLTHGQGMTIWFEERRQLYTDKRAQPLTIGSAYLDRLRRQFRKQPSTVGQRRPTVLLIPNVIPCSGRYLDCGNYPDVTEAEIQAEMVKVAGEFSQYVFIYKPFPGQSDTPAIRLAQQPASNCRVVTTKRLPDLMLEADLIVLNFPSTAMMEALCTDRPLLILVDQRSIKMLPLAKAALAKRAQVAETPRQFIDNLRAFLERGDFSHVTTPDQTFLEIYGTHLNDGRSAERARAAILSPHA